MLELLGESEGPLGLADVCERMDLHKSTAHRALMVLERCGLIERTPENRFRLGLKLYELGSRAVEQIDLRARVHPWFRRLSAQVGETIHLGVLQKTSVVYLDKVEPNNRRMWLSSRIGASNPVYCTAMGKAMLAFLPEEAAAEIIGKIRFVRFTHRTLMTPEALLRSLDRVRRRGYAIDDRGSGGWGALHRCADPERERASDGRGERLRADFEDHSAERAGHCGTSDAVLPGDFGFAGRAGAEAGPCAFAICAALRSLAGSR